jgi:hypothetical protein
VASRLYSTTRQLYTRVFLLLRHLDLTSVGSPTLVALIDIYVTGLILLNVRQTQTRVRHFLPGCCGPCPCPRAACWHYPGGQTVHYVRGEKCHAAVWNGLMTLGSRRNQKRLRSRPATPAPVHTSRFFTSLAWVSMNFLRGATLLPMRMSKISLARLASSMSTRSRTRLAGSIVVSQS